MIPTDEVAKLRPMQRWRAGCSPAARRPAARWVRLAVICGVVCAVASAVHAQGDDRRAAAIRRACAVGALPAAECASTAPSADTGARPAAGRTFTDPRGRYSFTTPTGWTLKLQGDTPGLQRGDAWIEVVATSAASPQAAAQAVGATFQPAFSRIELVNQGPTQVAGHEAFGINAGGVTRAKGRRMSVLLLAVSAGGGHDLVVISAVPVEEAQALNPEVTALASSIRFQGG